MSWNIDNCIPKPFSDALASLCKVELELDPILQNHWSVHLLVTNDNDNDIDYDCYNDNENVDDSF